VGELVTTHGLLGWIKLHPYNPHTGTFPAARSIHLCKGNSFRSCQIENCRVFHQDFLLKLAGIDSIDDAEAWVGSVVSVDESLLQPLEAGEYYYHQVLGLDVFDSHDQWLGRVARIWPKPGGDLYIVTGTGKEYLIPAVSEIIEKVDLVEGKVIINPPPGLLEL
jgi:16S rRNA processing protein RimM